VKVAIQTVPGSLCDAGLFELVPSAQSASGAHTSSVPAGFGVGRPCSKVVRQRARKRSQQAGRVVIKLNCTNGTLDGCYT
jgi:hypothetical protein